MTKEKEPKIREVFTEVSTADIHSIMTNIEQNKVTLNDLTSYSNLALDVKADSRIKRTTQVLSKNLSASKGFEQKQRLLDIVRSTRLPEEDKITTCSINSWSKKTKPSRKIPDHSKKY